MSAEHGMPIADEEAVQQFIAFYERAQESAEDMMLSLHKAASDYTATDLIDVARMDECRPGPCRPACATSVYRTDTECACA